MPGKKNSKKGPAGNSGLTGTASQDQTPDQAMGTDNSSVAVGTPPQQGAQLEESHNAIIKAFDDLYDQLPKTEVKADDMLPGDASETQSNEGDPEDGEGLEEDDEFLLPESQRFVPGTAEDFAEKMRFNGLRWRHELRKKVRD